MSEELIVKECAPTLAWLKTGSISSCQYESTTSLFRELAELNSRLSAKGVRIVLLSLSNDRALIYLYRPFCLRKDFLETDRATLLTEFGYEATIPNRCLSRLIHKIRTKTSFPHEIGLFLGYPTEDVLGFIKNKAKDYKHVGCWKVYGNSFEALKKFKNYEKCRKIYEKCFFAGSSLEKLTVKTK